MTATHGATSWAVGTTPLAGVQRSGIVNTAPGWRRVSVVSGPWSVVRSDERSPLATDHRRAIGGI